MSAISLADCVVTFDTLNTGDCSGCALYIWSHKTRLQPVLQILLCATALCCSTYMPRQFRPSVCLSVTRAYCIKTAECIIKILSPSDRTIILVFRHQGSLRKSDGFNPNGGTKYKRGRNFQRICSYISERVLDTGNQDRQYCQTLSPVTIWFQGLSLKAKDRTKDLSHVLYKSLRPGPRPRTNISDL